jgi:hypothetical protein
MVATIAGPDELSEDLIPPRLGRPTRWTAAMTVTDDALNEWLRAIPQVLAYVMPELSLI